MRSVKVSTARPVRSFKYGTTKLSDSASISAGTPGSKITGFSPSSISRPGAVPTGLGQAWAPRGKSA